MTLAESTRYRNLQKRSAIEAPARVDFMQVLRLVVFVAYVVLLIVLA